MMKNIQVIDAAVNCTYDVFSIEKNYFSKIFPHERDIEFVEDFYERIDKDIADSILNELWKVRLDKKSALGIHGTLFFGLRREKKQFYPTKKEKEMIVVIPKR